LLAIRDFLPAASGWDHLLMDQDDPEKRIADLEHQLAERMRGADLPPALPRTWVSVDLSGFQQVGAPGDEAGFGGHRPRRTVGWTGRVDVETIVVIGIVAPVLVTMLIPSSALWTSGIVCNTPSHLAYSQSLSLGHATSSTFQCVSGASSYAASKLAIYALQTLVSALVLCGTVAAGRLTWRLSRKRSLTYTVIALCLAGPLALDLVAAAKWQEWQESSGRHSTQPVGQLPVPGTPPVDRHKPGDSSALPGVVT
jgi:hypothetical protein